MTSSNPSWFRVVTRAVELFGKSLFFGNAYLWRRVVLRQPRDVALGMMLASLSDSLGGAFIKIGQLLSARADLLPPDVIAALSHLREDVAPFARHLGKQQLTTYVGAPLAAVLVEADPSPVAAASVAQVHRARLADGSTVALKLRRPGLGMKLRTDILLADVMTRAVARLPALRSVPLSGLMREVNETLVQQLDFCREARMTTRLRRVFSDRSDVLIPAVRSELCDDACLVTSFVDDLEPLDVASLSPAARVRAAHAAVDLLFQMVFVEGIVHCDMHVGNLFCRRDGSLVLLDFGFVCELADAVRYSFTEFFVAFASGDGKSCARVLVDTATGFGDAFDREAFDDEMVNMIARHHARTAESFEVAAFAVELFDLQRRFTVVGSTAFTMTIIAFLVLEGVIKTLHPTMDFQADARRFFMERPQVWRRVRTAEETAPREMRTGRST